MGMKQTLIIGLAVGSFASFGADVLPKAQKDYLATRTRIVARDCATIPGSIILTYVKGTEAWKTTNVIERMTRDVGPVKYSKLKLIVNAKAAGQWATVKSAIVQLDLEDEWNACQFIASDYPAFIAATNQVVTLGVCTDEAMKAFLANSIDKD